MKFTNKEILMIEILVEERLREMDKFGYKVNKELLEGILLKTSVMYNGDNDVI